jgi:hypothetical protein
VCGKMSWRGVTGIEYPDWLLHGMRLKPPPLSIHNARNQVWLLLHCKYSENPVEVSGLPPFLIQIIQLDQLLGVRSVNEKGCHL